MKFLPAFIRIFLFSSLLVSFCSHSAIADDIRKPAVAGLWYPANRQKLEQVIEQLTVQARKTRITIPPNNQLNALILPHAGYIYSGLTAAPQGYPAGTGSSSRF
jgi:predicted class III extradiol MEMO1 family dioxygenase